MSQKLKLTLFSIILLGIPLLASAHDFNTNKSITVDESATSKGRSTVNGSITVGRNAVVSGSLETVNGTIRIDDNVELTDVSTVNGGIRIGDDSRAEDVSSVNGSLRIGERGSIAGEVSAVNGKIYLANGSSVAQDVSNVNGQIEVIGTEIGGDLSTVSGDVLLTDNSTLRGNLIIEKPGGLRWGKTRRKPVVVIGPGSKVLGNITAEQEIELFISDTAEVRTVEGEVSMSDAVRFSGDRP
jgi:predicted acyltransferase (DUF342 family)